MNAIKHCVLALLIRFGLLFYGAFQDAFFVVKYTDVDYYVFSDAARYLYNGGSPFDRHTYRYSPLLALLLCPNVFLHEAFGKVLFSIFDVLTGLLMYYILQNCGFNLKLCKTSSALWLYNPVCAVIATRGSSDSIITALIMMCLLFIQRKNIILSGLIYGLAVHLKLYPCIYALTFYVVLSKFPSGEFSAKLKMYHAVLPNKEKCYFILFAFLGFVVPTTLSFYLYGKDYIDEAWLYHLFRKDIRHNFSPYFYLTYLSEYYSDQTMSTLSLLPFGLQFLLLFLVACTFHTPQTLSPCLFIQTCIFVTFNKVCTSQYFLWYLSLFPLCLPLLNLRWYSIVGVTCMWLGSQILWLVPAYYLEFLGMNYFIQVWIAGLIMFGVNVFLFNGFIKLCPFVENRIRSEKKTN